jgi:hypothetical protein
MQLIEYRRLGDPMIIRVSVTLGLLFHVGTERFGSHRFGAPHLRLCAWGSEA